MRGAIAILVAAASGWACGCAPDAGPSSAAGGVPAPSFTEIGAEAGLTLVGRCGDARKTSLLETLGSGVAVEDYDGDGDLDIYVGTAQTTADRRAGRAPAANALYRNDGDWTFTDVAGPAGVDLRAWTTGVGFADHDGDGDPDLFVTAWGRDTLLRNDGDGTFTDVTDAAGVGGPADAWSAGFAFGDLDGDGDLDLWLTRYARIDPDDDRRMVWKGLRVPIGPRGLPAEHDTLYRNDGDGTFTDVSAAAGLRRGEAHFGLGVALSDLDGDGDLDAYVANDSMGNHLWRNDGDLTFGEVGDVAGVAVNEDAREQAGMGVDAADQDGDGDPDLVVTNFSHDFNTLYRNDGDLRFTDATFAAGLSDSFTALSWGVRIADLDLDGIQDVIVANGHIYPEVDAAPQLNSTYRQRNSLYLGRPDGTLENVAAEAGPGLAVVESSRGLALGDLDRDGDLDVVVTNLDAPPSLLRNDTPRGDGRRWIEVRLAGAGANPAAVGARVAVTAGGRVRVREVGPYGSYLSSSPAEVHVGLGDATEVEVVEVRWPGGAVDRWTGLAVDRRYLLRAGGGLEMLADDGGPR